MKQVKTYEFNPLSLMPGGVTVELTYANGKIEKHPRIKYPFHYVTRVLEDCAKEGRTLLEAIVVETGDKVWDGKKLTKVKI